MAYSDLILSDSPVAYWKLDDTSGTTVTDSSGNGYHGTYVGSPTLGADPLITSGTSVSFNGSSQYVSTGAVAGLNFGTGDFSVEFWVNGGAQPVNYPDLIATGNTSFSAGAITIRLDHTSAANKITVHANGLGDPFLTSSNTFADNLSHHVVLRRIGDAWNLIIDGVLEATNTSSASVNFNTNGTTYFARNNWDGANGYFNGRIDEVAFYNYALSPATIYQHYTMGTSGSIGTTYYDTVIADSPDLYFTFSEESGTTVVDEIGGITGTLVNGLDLTSDSLTTDGGTSVTVAATVDYMVVPKASGWCNVGTGDYTFEFWFNFQGAAHQDKILFDGRRAGAGPNFLISTGATAADYGKLRVSSTSTIVGTNRYTDKRPHHGVVTRESGTLTLYVDGVAEASAGSDVINWNDTTGNYTFFSNSYSTPTGVPTGIYDEIAFYSYALSSTQVLAHYNAGHADYASESTYQAQVVTDEAEYYWEMDEASGDLVDTINGLTLVAQGTGGIYQQASDVLDSTSIDLEGTQRYWTAETLTGAGGSIEAWVNTTSTTDNQMIFAYHTGNGASNHYAFLATMSTGKLRLQFYNGGLAQLNTTGATVNDGNWHHIVVTSDSYTIKFYIDGVLDTTIDSTYWFDSITLPATRYLAIGGCQISSSGQYYFDGLLDQISYYSYPLTADQVDSHYTLATIGGTITNTIGALTLTGHQATVVFPINVSTELTNLNLSTYNAIVKYGAPVTIKSSIAELNLTEKNGLAYTASNTSEGPFIDNTTVIEPDWCQRVNDHVYRNGTHSADDVLYTYAGTNTTTTLQTVLNKVVTGVTSDPNYDFYDLVNGSILDVSDKKLLYVLNDSNFVLAGVTGGSHGQEINIFVPDTCYIIGEIADISSGYNLIGAGGYSYKVNGQGFIKIIWFNGYGLYLAYEVL